MTDILAHVDELDAITQLQLLQDLRLLAEGRQISYATVVPLLKRFAASQSTVVQTALYQVAGNLKKFVTPDTTEATQLKQLFDQLSQAQVKRLGWLPKATDSNDDLLTRPMVLSAALYGQNATAIADAHQLFETNQGHLDRLPAGIRGLILTNEVTHYGSRELIDQLLVAYRQTADASYKSDIRAAVTSTPATDLIALVIEQFEDAQTVKPQDLRGWFRGVLVNEKGEQAAWDWIRNDWDWLEATVGGDMEFATFITVITNAFKTPERFKEFKAFFEPKINTPGLTREITMDMSVIQSRVALIEAERTAVNAAVAQVIK